MEQTQDIYQFILTEEEAYKTNRVPITKSKDWNMHEHIERCTNVANAWFHTGQNDGERPYDDIVTPIIDVSFRSEGFDVKDIIPYVNDAMNYYKSFLVKKFHPQWARKNELDSFIDELVETSIIYDLALIKKGKVRPEVVKLQTIAFCDQTDVLSGALCIKHQFTPAELLAQSDKWDSEMVKLSIAMAKSEKVVPNAADKTVKTPGKYIEVYELRGNLPDEWINGKDEYVATEGTYSEQVHFICYYTNSDGKKAGITLFGGKSRKLTDTFKALKIDVVRSHGRACGRSVVERLFEPQVWRNYDAIKIKAMLDAAIDLLQTDSDDIGGQRIDDLKKNTILKHDTGKPITKIHSELTNMPVFTADKAQWAENARLQGSAQEGQFGITPPSGTPFALQQAVLQEGAGMHTYRQGKIATFVADVLYRDWILPFLVEEMNTGKKFSEELTLDEMQEIAEKIATNKVESQLKEDILNGKIVTQEQKDAAMKFEMDKFMKGGNRKFFETVKSELNDIPVSVSVNIKGKQKYMAQIADKLTNIVRTIMANPAAIAQIPGLGKTFNELLENSGLSPIDFSQITKAPIPAPAPLALPQESTQFKVAA